MGQRTITGTGAMQMVVGGRPCSRRRVPSLALAALICVPLWFLSSCSGDEAPTNDAKVFALSDTMLSRIGLDTVRLMPVENTVELNARITPDDGRLANVYPIVGGQVSDVNVELGDHVNKGQTLAIIRSSQVADLERKLIDARSDMEVAEKNLSSKQDLFNSQLLSERKLVEARYELEKAKAKLKGMDEIFSIYQFQDGSQYVVKAPISGYVIDKAVVRDETLPEDHDEAIFTIAELDRVWVLADVYESDIARVKEGMTAQITTLSYPDKVFNGHVDKILNMLDPRTRTMRIRITLPNPDVMLKPEMIARVRLVYQEDRSLPAIPASAIISDNDRDHVMVFKDRMNIDTRRVHIDRTTDRTSWVAEGLQPGEVIVSKEQLFLYDALNDR
ncbi:MAG: efflux RND transporter periplasmic adaptor subunit [Flavobacteriales bacterium]|nr:efflux RND transporter periplasmic adaptor subunit [Flavobacteriales bacterium]